MAKEMKERLHTTIEKLPEERLGEVLDFMQFLLKKDRRNSKRTHIRDPDGDPILEYIGGVSHGSLAKDIDSALYGEMQ